MSGDGTGGYLLDETRSLTAAAWGAAVDLLLSECTPDGLVTLLECEAGDIMRAAIVCLGLKGDMTHCRPLAGLLRHHDAEVVRLAESSLWQLWLRAGSSWGNSMLVRANELIRDGEFDRAAHVLDQLTAAEPDFAEAYNQRGIALHLLERFEEAAAAFGQAVRLNRYHFLAALSLGHVCVERGDLKGAFRYYRYALRIHPRLEEIPETVKRLEVVVGNGSVSH